MKLKKLHIFLLFLAVLVFGSLSCGFIEGLENKEESDDSDIIESHKGKSHVVKHKVTTNDEEDDEEDDEELDENSALDEADGDISSFQTILDKVQITNPVTPGYTTAISGDGPEGVPSTSIPPGDEDLYILKSEIVPPVCPACPTSASCPREKPCRPCPPCARCPEPAFECKKVPNYRSGNSDYLPKPVLNDFGEFGM